MTKTMKINAQALSGHVFNLLQKISNLETGWRIETRDMRDCSHKNERDPGRTVVAARA